MNPLVYFLESLDFLDWWMLAAVLALVDVFRPHWRLLGFAGAAGLRVIFYAAMPEMKNQFNS